MKTFKIFIFVFGLIVAWPLASCAQRDVFNWQISPYAGLLTLNNDVEVPEGVSSFAYGLRVEKRLGNSFTFGLHLAQLEIDRASQNNVTGGFLSLAYHWDNGYLFSQRSAISIFHRLEAGYMDRYSTIESINGKSADVAFGFENGFKLRFGDRVSADIAVEILGTKSSVTEGDIAKNQRYNIWKVGLSYHFRSRESNFVAPVFVPYDGIPFGSKMSKIERKDDNIWIANDSIYNSQLKEERFPEPADNSNPVRTELSRADSLLIFMHFDRLYKRRDLQDTAFVNTDTLATDKENLKSIPDSSMVPADTIAVGKIEESLKDSSYSEITSQDSVVVNEGDTTYVGKAAISSDSVMVNKRNKISIQEAAILADSSGVNQTDTLSSQKSDYQLEKSNKVNNASADTVMTNSNKVQKIDSSHVKNASADTAGTNSDNTKQKSDTVSQVKSKILPGARVDTTYTEKSKGDNQKTDGTAKQEEQKVEATKADSSMNKSENITPGRKDNVDNEKSTRDNQKTDSTTLNVKEKSQSSTVDKSMKKDETVAPARVDTVDDEKSTRDNQKTDSTSLSVKEKSQSSTVDKSMKKDETVATTRVDTVYLDKSERSNASLGVAAEAAQGQAEPSRVDTVYMIQDAPQQKSAKSESDKKDKSDNDDTKRANEKVADNTSANQKNNDNIDANQSNLDRQNDLLIQQNQQIRDNQREIERLRRQNRKSDTGKVLAAGAAGTALGAAAASGNNQKPDTVYYESNAAQQKLDSLEQELTELKKQYGITDTIPAQADTNYIPDPPIGMYFDADSTGTDSLGAASGDGTVLNSDSLRMQKDLLGLSDSLSADSLSRAEFANGILEPTVRSDEDEIRANSTIVEDKSSAQQDVEANPIVLIGNYPVVCNFGLNKTLLDAGELKKLDPVITDLKNDNTLKVFLTGYTDNSGNADYNLKLSKERAKSVMDYLIAEGVAADRIEDRGSGVLDSADKYSPNARRVDVTIGD